MSLLDWLLHGDEYLEQLGKLTQRTAYLEQELVQERRERQQLQQEVRQLQQRLQQLQQQLRQPAKPQAPVQAPAKASVQIPVQTPVQEQSVKKAAPAKPAPVTSKTEAKPFDIARFSLAKTDKILIRTSSDIERAVQKIKNTDGLYAFLQKCDDKEAVMITKIMEEYRKRIERFEASLPQKRKKWDEDMVSEEATSALFSIMKKSLLTTLPVTILRGSIRNPSFYGRLLAELNQYLLQCGVYTLMPSSKERFNADDCDFMEIQPLPTKNHGDDRRVESIERLPYCLDYLDEDEDRQVCRLDGQMAVYRFEA